MNPTPESLKQEALGQVAVASDPKAEDLALFKQALHEIESLKAHVMELERYRNHTERMLALFEGGPRNTSTWGAEHPSTSYRLRERIARDEGYEKAVS